MATWEDVSRLARELPDSEESTSYGKAAWKLKGKGFVWQRPLSKADRAALGEAAPPNDVIVAVSVGGLDEKEAVLAEHPDYCFTTPHFDGYPAVLVRLDTVPAALLSELVTDAWLAHAPTKLAEDFLGDHPL